MTGGAASTEPAMSRPSSLDRSDRNVARYCWTTNRSGVVIVMIGQT